MKLKISNSATVFKLIQEGKYVLFSNLLERITFFVVFIVLARSLPKNIYGFITSIFVFSNILYSFFDFGLPFYFQREFAISNNNHIKEIGSILRLKIYLFLLYITFVLLYFKGEILENTSLILIISISIYIFGTNSLFNSILLGKRLYRTSFLLMLFSRCMFLLAFLLSSFYNLNVNFIIYNFLIAALLHSILLINQLDKKGLRIDLRIVDRDKIIKIFKSSIPIGAGLIFVWFYDKVDVLIIQNIISFKAVASYAIAYSLYKTMQIIPGILLVPAYNNFSRNFSTENFINWKELKPIIMFLTFISLIVITVFYFSADIIILIIYGRKYLSSAPYLKGLIFAIPGLFLNNLTGVISNSIRKETFPLIGTGIGAMVNISFNIIMVGAIGIWGAVYSTIIAEYLVLIIQLGLLRKYYSSFKYIRI